MTTATGSPVSHAGADLVLCELFGPTIQGEGPSAGERAVFVRLGDCNLACGPCDTKHSWDWKNYVRSEETQLVALADVAQAVLALDASLVVVTGGEPLLQQARLALLAERLVAAGRRVEVETNGTVAPVPELDRFIHLYVVSPKLAHMGMSTARRIRPEVLKAFLATGRAVFKVVLDGPEDVPELVELQEAHGLTPVWVMPQATAADEVIAGMRALAEPALRHGWNLSPRLHCLIWGDERGR
ncbi:7-carboxy-7-deazaguanine synthase QueE [Streptomyces sp. NPDC058701]|uniref:7-carboxy-7-deazaguanine synthase QueE n=1 Tax=Streptomyces sp. NPDC058701 TaxID=3346608 RepID=UPI003663C116